MYDHARASDADAAIKQAVTFPIPSLAACTLAGVDSDRDNEKLRVTHVGGPYVDDRGIDRRDRRGRGGAFGTGVPLTGVAGGELGGRDRKTSEKSLANGELPMNEVWRLEFP